MKKEKKIIEQQLPRLENLHINETGGQVESITDNGISTTTELGQEQYVQCVLGAFRGKIYYQYDYRDMDNELFSTLAETLEECRKRRNEWLNKKNQKL